jgi:hypothetical protein
MGIGDKTGSPGEVPECRTTVKDLDAVRRRLDAKKDFITCQECEEKMPLIDFIEQWLKKYPVACRFQRWMADCR